jgi:hypothetical protein
MLIAMVDVLILLCSALIRLFRSRVRFEAEILVLRRQINVLRRKSPKRSVFRPFDRLVLVGLYRLAPSIVDALAIVSGARPVSTANCSSSASTSARRALQSTWPGGGEGR